MKTPLRTILFLVYKKTLFTMVAMFFMQMALTVSIPLAFLIMSL